MTNSVRRLGVGGCEWTDSSVFNVISVRRMQSKGILVQVFPLHEKEELKRLSFSWFKKIKLSFQPLGKLQLPWLDHFAL